MRLQWLRRTDYSSDIWVSTDGVAWKTVNMATAGTKGILVDGATAFARFVVAASVPVPARDADRNVSQDALAMVVSRRQHVVQGCPEPGADRQPGFGQRPAHQRQYPSGGRHDLGQGRDEPGLDLNRRPGLDIRSGSAGL